MSPVLLEPALYAASDWRCCFKPCHIWRNGERRRRKQGRETERGIVTSHRKSSFRKKLLTEIDMMGIILLAKTIKCIQHGLHFLKVELFSQAKLLMPLNSSIRPNQNKNVSSLTTSEGNDSSNSAWSELIFNQMESVVVNHRWWSTSAPRVDLVKYV